jgi:hypothetical protein
LKKYLFNMPASNRRRKSSRVPTKYKELPWEQRLQLQDKDLERAKKVGTETEKIKFKRDRRGKIKLNQIPIAKAPKIRSDELLAIHQDGNNQARMVDESSELEYGDEITEEDVSELLSPDPFRDVISAEQPRTRASVSASEQVDEHLTKEELVKKLHTLKRELKSWSDRAISAEMELAMLKEKNGKSKRGFKSTAS